MADRGGAWREVAAIVGTAPEARERPLHAVVRFWRLRRFPYLYLTDTTPPHILRVVHMSRDLPTLLAT